jgi:hypothetical protein
MFDTNVYKFFENLLDEKAKYNSSYQTAKNITDFTLEFVFMQYGLKSIAHKHIGSMLNALARM